MTGWGQERPPRVCRAGHDLNYIALTGALHAIGRKGRTAHAAAQSSGRLRRRIALSSRWACSRRSSKHARSGQGQVVDAAIVDGTASLMTAVVRPIRCGPHLAGTGTNTLDSGAHYYDVYECADGSGFPWLRSSKNSEGNSFNSWICGTARLTAVTAPTGMNCEALSPSNSRHALARIGCQTSKEPTPASPRYCR